MSSLEFLDSSSINNAFIRSHFHVSSEEEQQFDLENVSISVPLQSYERDFMLSVQELRSSDYAPTGMALKNVTKNGTAYRFLPDGITFEKDIQIKMKYDHQALPVGHSAKDIQVFYFDTTIKQWSKVKVLAILEETHEIVALTNHFTDYLAGVIQEPESPETNAFASTTVTGIQAASSTENIPMVSVPKINDRGDAVLNFPLLMPPGRQGMTPDLSVTYNSGGDEGDFGLGWSLSVATIAVDTRWGVPTYDSSKETESYTMNGEELMLVKLDKSLYVPHKDVLMNRLANAVFQKGQHDPTVVITREGSSPNSYTWVVDDSKTGWKYTYDIYSKGKWYLRNVIDVFGNYMEYGYDQNATGDLQLRNIEYNQNDLHLGTNKGRHAFYVDIYRKNTIDVPQVARQDTRINNRYGVESRSVDLIDKIMIRSIPCASFIGSETLDNAVYNEYRFLYKAGKFGRSLLYKIVNSNYSNQNGLELENQKDVTLFPVVEEYTFDYHDDIGNGELFEASGKKIITYEDYRTDYDKYGVFISALGGSEGKSSNFGGGGSGGIVTPFFPASWLPFSRSATVGGNGGGSSSNSETKVMMADIDGDGLPDKVFKAGDSFYYRKNNDGSFSQDVYNIKKLPNLGYSKSSGSEESWSVNILAGGVHKSSSKNRSTTYTYMTDVNSDGLLDVVNNERVYFGYINPQTKEPTFSLDSSITPAIVLKEDDVAPILNPLPEIDLTNGPMDLVMVWRAPKNGSITISGEITKNFVALESGVKFSIEKLHESNMGAASFLLGPHLLLSNSQAHHSTVSVIKGDLLFFRVHTNQIPIEELGIRWNPQVSYSGPNPDPVMSSSRHTSNYKESFIVGSGYEEAFKKKGQFRLEWPSFTLYDRDRVTIRVSYFKKDTDEGGNIPLIGNDVVVYEQTSGILESSLFASPNITLDMSSITSVPTSFHYVKVEVLSDTEIDWKVIDTKFKPKLVSLNAENEDIYLVPYYSNYSKVHIINNPMTFVSNGTGFKVKMNNNFTLPGCTEAACKDRYVYLTAKYYNGDIMTLYRNSNGAFMGYVKFRYKIAANGTVVQKQRLNQNYIYENVGDSYEFSTTSSVGKKYFFEYYSPEYNLAKKLDEYQKAGTNSLIRLEGTKPFSNHATGVDVNGRILASIYSSENTTAWGAMYRNWGQFAYKGADVGGEYEPIVGEHIQIFNPENTTSSGENINDIMEDESLTLEDVDANFEDLLSLGGNASVYFGVLMPEKKRNRWYSHEHLYITDTEISPYVRFLTDDIPDLMAPTAPVGNFGAFGINKYSFFKNKSTNYSIGFLLLSAGNTKTEGSSELLNEFMDVNGDGFPDIIGTKIQLTAKRGGLSSKIIDVDLNTKTTLNGSGNMVGGASSGIKGSPALNGNSQLGITVGNQSSVSSGGSLNGSSFNTKNETTRFYVDVNGDGLVDIVQSNGKVLFNYGGTFSGTPNWGALPLQSSKTTTAGIGGGLSFSGFSNLDVSFGLSISGSTSRDEVTFMDLNGDGLPEQIVGGTKYYINNGTHFNSEQKTLPGQQAQKSIEAGINGNVNICVYFPIPIIFTGPKFCFTVSGAKGQNYSSEESRYMDFDGDGYPDYVTSSKNDGVTVYKSRIKRTNLLKKVTQTTGATIELDYATANPIDKKVIGSTYKMPFKKWALTEVSVYDGFVGDGNNTTRYSYEYYNGYKDRKERSFLGFGVTKAHLLDKNGKAFRTDVTEYFINDMTDYQLYRPGTSSDLKQYLYKKGLTKKTYTLDKSKRLLNETDYNYKFYDSSKIIGDLNTTTSLSSEITVFTEKMSVLPLVTSIQNREFHYNDSGGSPMIFETEQKFTLYDKKGNVKKYLDVDRDVLVEIEYNLGIKTLPISHYVRKAAYNVPLRSTKSIVAPNGVKYSEVRKYSDSSEFTSIKYEYNELGNLSKTILPGGFYKYDYSAGINNEDGTSDYHGNYFKVTPSMVTDHFGNQYMTLNNAFGLSLKVKDNYGEEATYSYDAFNRLLTFKGPYENDWTIKNEYVNNRVAITKHNLGASILHTSTINDGLGRTVQVKKELLAETDPDICDPNFNKSFHLSVSGKVFYDEFGRVVEQYLSDEVNYCIPEPTEDTIETYLAQYIDIPSVLEKKIGKKYDYRDRVTEELVYGLNAKTTTNYLMEGDSFGAPAVVQEVILPEGNTTRSYINKLGLMTFQLQIGLNDALETIYAYDPLGQVEQIQNAMGHTYNYLYDLLGQVIYKASSGTAPTTFEYDKLGQVTEKKVGVHNTITYQYDFNRLIQVNHPSIMTSFNYDQGGRLKKMVDLSGEHTFEYGKLGEVIEETKSVWSMFGTTHHFKTHYTYDSWGRLLEMTYPDRERVLYGYNAIGQLIEVKNEEDYYYLKDVKYNYFDQPTYIKYGNDVEMIQEYDLNERLRVAQLSAPSMDNPDNLNIFSRNVYNYDKKNNIRSVLNQHSQHNAIVVGGKSYKEYFYDSFNRLEHAAGSWDGLLESHQYILYMAYNRDHSILSKNQYHVYTDYNLGLSMETENSVDRHYEYGWQGTPRLTQLRGYGVNAFEQGFSYDPSGNIYTTDYNIPPPNATFINRMFTWDANNNITGITDDYGAVYNQYVYDGQGERIVKRSNAGNNVVINGGDPTHGMYGTNEVLYPSGNLVYNDRIYTKHYYANGKRLASRIDESNRVNFFIDINFNDKAPTAAKGMMFSPFGTSNYEAKGMGSGAFEPMGANGSNQALSEQICENQINILFNVLYNSAETQDCRNQLIVIMERHIIYYEACVLYDSVTGNCIQTGIVGESINYCDALEEINALGCVERTPDGGIIDPVTGYIYDPITGHPYDPVTGLPIVLVGGGVAIDQLQLDCFMQFLNYMDYYRDRDDKPREYNYFLEILECLLCIEDCDYKCGNLRRVAVPWIDGEEQVGYLTSGGYVIDFCNLGFYPSFTPEPEEPREEPEEPEIDLGDGIEDPWVDDPPGHTDIVAPVFNEEVPVWWYHSDHLGSSSYITDILGKPVQYYEYLPFGEIMVQQSTNNIFENVYKFNGKELDEQTGYYYYGARYYDPGASIFLSVDPLAEKYPNINPYVYVANNPINAIDPDGRVIIFINGMHTGDGGSSKYWNGLDKRLQNRIGDNHARYYDGSKGGATGLTGLGGMLSSNLFSGNRRRAGKAMGALHAAEIFNNLGDGETIKLATHSMGGSYGKGFIQGLKKYAKDNGIDINGLIEFEVDLAPFQPKSQHAEASVPTITVSHEGDNVAGSDPMQGANNNVERKGEKRGLYEHSVDSFSQDEINKHVPRSENNRSGKSTWEQKPKR